MKGVTNRFSILVIGALVIMGGLSHAVERESSVSGAVYRGNEPDLGLTDLWLATLSKQATLNVLDRAEMRAILGELSLAGVSDDSARQVRLGRLLGIDYFAWIKASDEQALMEVVEAATGRGITVVPVRFAKGQFAEILPKLAEQAVQALSRPLPSPSQGALSVAFSIPRFSVSNETVQAAVETVIADLAGNMANAGLTVLPRRFVADAVQERWRQEKGLVEDISQGQAFLGADYILGIAVDATNRIELIMVKTAIGRRVGRKEMPLEEAQTVDGVNALTQWGLDRLKPLLEYPSVLPPAAVTNGHYAAPEILKSLYAGMVLHNQGRYLDALPKFEDSKSRKIHVDEIDAWIVNCYRLAGFPEIANEVSAAAAAPYYNKINLTLNAQSGPGVAVLGVTAAAGIPDGLAERIGILLIDRLHKAAGVTVLASEDDRLHKAAEMTVRASEDIAGLRTVLAPEDIAGLRDEYDLLLGLDKVKGTTWRQAPRILLREAKTPILLREAITAHLEPDNAGVRLRLCLIRNCNPTSIYDVVTSLSADHAQWQPLIDKAAKELLSRSDRGSPVWLPPNLKVEEDQQQLLSQLEESIMPLTYLKALSRNPDLTKFYRLEVPWRKGLSHWFLRVLPEGHPDRPMLEFMVVSSRSEFQKIADKYPSRLVGLLSRYNVALIDMTPANYAATQINIGRLLPELSRFEHGETDYIIVSIRKMDSALCYTLGLPGGEPANIFRYGGLITAYGWLFNPPHTRLFTDGTTSISCRFYHLINNIRFQPRTIDQMRLDLEAYCLLCHPRDQSVDLACFLRDIIEKNGPDADITQYAVIKYFPNLMDALAVFKIWPEEAEEGLCVVCPVYADSLQKLFAREPMSINNFTVEQLLNLGWDRLPKNPIITNAIHKAQEVIRSFASFSREQRRKFEESWKVGPLQDFTWQDFCDKETWGPDIIELYYPYLNRLHELYDHEPKSRAICRLYCQFGLAFFRAGRYDLAEPLFDQIISWKDNKNRPPEEEVYALSLYLLALLKQRNGDTPSALRLAKEAMAYMDNQPQTSFRLYQYIGTGNARWIGGFDGDLKARATAFIKELRENPRLAFKDPY